MRPSIQSLAETEPAPFETTSAPLVHAERPWVLFVGRDARALEDAARRFIQDVWRLAGKELPVVTPPDEPVLPVAAHLLEPPSIAGERVLYAPRLELWFFDTLASGAFSAASPLYLLPKLTQLASEGEPLYVVATGSEAVLRSRAQEVLAQRGLASRFEIRRAPAPPADPPPPEETTLEDRGGATFETLLETGLRTREPEVRARAYREALSREPESGLAHLFLASSLLERRQLAAAVDVLKKAVALEPDLAPAHYELGKALIQADDMKGALASFRRTAELVPEFSSAWGNLGAALGELQELEAAAEALHRAVELDPSNHALLSNLGVTYRDQGKLDAAEQTFRKVLELAPDFVFGHYNLAHVHFLQGRHAEAIESFEEARSMDRSRSPRQGLLLAATRLASGDVEGAFRDYREVFGRLEGQMKRDMRTVAEWDLKQLARRAGTSAGLREAVAFVRSLA